MTFEEFGLFASALKTYYPRENLVPNEKALELWFKQLEDIPFKVAEIGLQKWVSLNKWSPSIADIRDMSRDLIKGEIADYGEAWQEVQKAIRYFGFYREDEALDSLTPLTRKAVERLGFKNLCTSENPEASRANFRMIYESLAEREKKETQLPEKLKIIISDMKMIEGKEGD